MAALPPLIPLLATSALSIGFSVYQGVQQASAAQRAYDHQTAQASVEHQAAVEHQQALVEDREEQIAENEVRAVQHRRYQGLTEDMRLQQLREDLAQDTTELRKEGLRARGQVAARQASAGSVGQSAELVLADVRAQEAAQRSLMEGDFRQQQEAKALREAGFDIELSSNRRAIRPLIPAPITLNQPLAPNVSPFQAGVMSAVGESLQIGNRFAQHFFQGGGSPDLSGSG